MQYDVPQLQPMPDLNRVDLELAQAQQSRQQNALAQLAMARAQREEQGRNALAQVLSGGENPEALANLAKQSPETYFQYQTHQKAQEDMKLKRRQEAQKMAAQSLYYIAQQPEEERPALWAEAVPAFEQQYPEYAGTVPKQYSPAIMQQLMSQAVPPEKQMELGAREQERTLKNATPTLHTVQEGDTTKTVKVYPGGRIEEMSSAPRWNENARGMEVELADGTKIAMGGSKGGATESGLARTTQGEVEKELMQSGKGLMGTKQMMDSFNPAFQTYGGQIQGMWSALKDKMDPASLSDDQKKYLKDFATWRAQAGRVFSNTLKELSGTAVNPTEYQRARAYLPEPGTGWFDGDSPEQAKAKMEDFAKFHRNAIARLNYMRKNGFSIQNAPEGSVPELDSMNDILRMRGRQIEAEIKKANPKASDAQVTETTKRKLAEEFGLVY